MKKSKEKLCVAQHKGPHLPGGSVAPVMWTLKITKCAFPQEVPGQASPPGPPASHHGSNLPGGKYTLNLTIGVLKTVLSVLATDGCLNRLLDIFPPFLSDPERALRCPPSFLFLLFWVKIHPLPLLLCAVIHRTLEMNTVLPVLHYTLYCTTLCTALNSVLHYTLYCTTLNYVLYYTLYCTTLCTALHSVLHYTLFCTTLNYVSHYTLYCTTLCTALH